MEIDEKMSFPAFTVGRDLDIFIFFNSIHFLHFYGIK